MEREPRNRGSIPKSPLQSVPEVDLMEREPRNWGSIPREGLRFLSSPHNPNNLWYRPNPLFKVHSR